jgi:hypothetical protein
MQAIARLGPSPYDAPRPSFDQLLSHDTFPNVAFSNDAHTEKPPVNGNQPNGLHQFFQQALTAASRIHAAIGVNPAQAGKPPENSGCPAAGLRRAFSGGSNNSGTQHG